MGEKYELDKSTDKAINEGVNLEYKQYINLSKHKEFENKIDEVLSIYPNIRKFVKIKYTAKFNKKRNTHQFIQVLYNHEALEYDHLLRKFNCLIGKYGDNLECVEKNIISNKTLSDFFAFYSELEVMEQLHKTFNELPEVVKSNNNKNPDFVLHHNQLIVEVKTTLESNKSLCDYIQNPEQQTQLCEISKKYPKYYKILIINSKYKHANFEKFKDSKKFLKNKNISWNCCMAYNNFVNRGDYFILNETEKKQQIINLFKNLRGEHVSFMSVGMQQNKVN